MYICIYIYIHYFMFNIGFTGFGFWKYIQVIFYIGHYHHIILFELYAQTPVLQINCCTNTSFYATLYTTLLLHKNGRNMTCIILKQDRYYKIMAGITCFCCPNKVIFSIRQSLSSHMQYFVYLLSQYIAAVNTDSWEVVSCTVKNIIEWLLCCVHSFL